MTTLTAPHHRYPFDHEHVGERLCDSSRVLLAPDRLPDHINALYRAAYALRIAPRRRRPRPGDLCPRAKAAQLIRRDHELGYLLRALRNTYYSHYRASARRPATLPLDDHVAGPAPKSPFRASEMMQAVASAPPAFRDAVIAVDIVGMSYKEAARALRTRQATITTRLHRGRQHVARVLGDAAKTN